MRSSAPSVGPRRDPPAGRPRDQGRSGPAGERLARPGIVSHIALNGAAAIHDFELAALRRHQRGCGESGLADGSFGMAEETGAEMNAAIAAAARADQGMGEGLARALADRKQLPGAEASILLAALRAQRAGHRARGDRRRDHSSAPGLRRRRVGATSHRDFRRLAGSIPDLDQGGVVLNWGSAVMMPEVFLKALTIARNTGAGRPTHFVAADFDMQRHYRPRVNVVQRPTRAGGTGFLLTGHHELLLPLLVWGVLEKLDG